MAAIFSYNLYCHRIPRCAACAIWVQCFLT